MKLLLTLFVVVVSAVAKREASTIVDELLSNDKVSQDPEFLLSLATQLLTTLTHGKFKLGASGGEKSLGCYDFIRDVKKEVQFEDISETGTEIDFNCGPGCDENVAITVTTNFKWFGIPVPTPVTVFVAVNGFACIEGFTSQADCTGRPNLGMATSGTPEGVMSPLGSYFTLESNFPGGVESGVFFQQDTERFIIQWNNLATNDSGGTPDGTLNTFQVQVYSSGAIYFAYSELMCLVRDLPLEVGLKPLYYQYPLGSRPAGTEVQCLYGDYGYPTESTVVKFKPAVCPVNCGVPA